jgi:hypothetical protein
MIFLAELFEYRFMEWVSFDLENGFFINDLLVKNYDYSATKLKINPQINE